MNPILPTSLIAIALTSAVAFAADLGPGEIDFGQIVPSANGKFVEVNIPEGLLRFGSLLAAKQEPQAAEVLRNLKRVRVNVVELNDANREATIQRVKEVRRELATRGWMPIVTVREDPKGDDVGIFAKMHGEEAIEGLVVTVINGTHEVVLINIVGDIKPEQIATLAERFDIDPLKKIELPKHHQS
jgi:hypothetical protein